MSIWLDNKGDFTIRNKFFSYYFIINYSMFVSHTIIYRWKKKSFQVAKIHGKKLKKC